MRHSFEEEVSRRQHLESLRAEAQLKVEERERECQDTKMTYDNEA